MAEIQGNGDTEVAVVELETPSRFSWRPIAVAATACALVIALVVAIVIARPDGSPRHVHALRPAPTADQPEVGPASEATTTTRGVEATTTTTGLANGRTRTTNPAAKSPVTPVPPPPAATTITAAPPTDRDRIEALYGPVPPGGKVFPSSVPASRWEGTSNGIHAVITMSSPAPATGLPVTFTVDYSGGDKYCCGFNLLTGDGGNYYENNGWSPPPACPDMPGNGQYAHDHTWNKPGFFYVVVGLFDRGCGNAAGGQFYVPVHVAAGLPPTTQGPSKPRFTSLGDFYDNGHGGDRHWLALIAETYDDDGFITHFTIDWGDGSAVDSIPGDGKCEVQPNGWPGQSRQVTPTPQAPTHHYPTAGNYTVTVTVFSTGCTGKDPQQTSKTMVWNVPPA
jgi:hypothetical protein